MRLHLPQGIFCACSEFASSADLFQHTAEHIDVLLPVKKSEARSYRSIFARSERGVTERRAMKTAPYANPASVKQIGYLLGRFAFYIKKKS